MNTQQVLAKVNLNDVTPEKIGRCHLVINPDGERVYKVENEQGKLDETGQIKEYTVRYSRQFGFTCTCDAGQFGFTHCKHGVCKHVKWSLAAAREERNALAEQARKANEQQAHCLIINGEVQSQQAVNALLNRPATKVFSHEVKQADALSRQRAFSLYR